MGISVGGLVSGIDPKIVDKLMEVERIPIKSLEKKKATVETKVKAVDELRGKMAELAGVLEAMTTRGEFFHLKMETSNPEIIDGTVSKDAVPGSYEFEVRGMARTEKELAYGFPDKDKFPVGFGWMLITNKDTDEDIVIRIDPDKNTLQDVANSINESEAGVKAIIVNTGADEDPYRLLVISEGSGKKAQVEIDPDTTNLEFKEQVTGSNLDVLFEDVPVTSPTNSLDELVPGTVFNVHKAAPGTKVTVNITFDIDGTFDGINQFVEKYNEVNKYIDDQFVYDQDKGRAGILSTSSGLRQIRRQMQYEMARTYSNTSKKYNTLASMGITTNAKDGSLMLDAAKVKQALAEDINGVSSLFVFSEENPGIAARLKDKLKDLSDREYGILESRKKGLTRVAKNLDEQILKKQTSLEKTHEGLKRRFSSLEQMMSSMNQQSQFLSQKFGGQAQGGQPQVRD